MPNFRPPAALVWEENEVTDAHGTSSILKQIPGSTDKVFLPQSIMKFLTPPLLHMG